VSAILKRELLPACALVVLALVLGGSVVTGRERPAPAPEPPRGEMRTAPPADFDLEKLKRSKEAHPITDLFEPKSLAPPPLAAAAAAPRAPAAPPLPFAYLGRIVDGGETKVFVIRNDEYFVVSGPDALDRQYRVEEVGPNAITFLHLPTGTRQVLPLPGPN
jgi:hypothetical protein